jgi:decaprenylphospho-beta-D-erythro-pentofuranosid-2-ulose 2-reductase
VSERPVLILGGRSDIGLATARRFASKGYPIQMAARNADALAPEKADLELRYNVPVTLHEFDALQFDLHESFVAGLETLPEIVICAVGVLGNQAECERDAHAAILVMRSNYEGPASIMAVLANRFEARGSGTLVGISSVAGNRGRASNYIYGSAKAGFTAFLSGLRSRLSRNGVHVVTVLPGFVATKMTDGMKLPAKLTATPEDCAIAIERAVTRRRSIVYVKQIWWLVMLVIQHIPEKFFKRMKV